LRNSIRFCRAPQALATRDKTRERRIYGCEGDPTPAMGLGMVRNDNGTGLRNVEVKSALMGIAAANTDVRTHASADKPYVERMFGTTESVLLKLLHGYTDRKGSPRKA
jgi:putative transposase